MNAPPAAKDVNTSDDSTPTPAAKDLNTSDDSTTTTPSASPAPPPGGGPVPNPALANIPLIHLGVARNRLLKVWVGGSGLVMLVLVIRTLMDGFGEEVNDIWSWFIPLVFPTLSLMVGVLGGTAFDHHYHKMVRQSYYQVCIWLSSFYILCLFLTVGIEAVNPGPALKLFHVANNFLTPLQGLVIAALGFLFTNAQTAKGVDQQHEQGV
ncbi:MAG: hypothetical protein HQL50_11745 [Magnetococcales bacterium]|nr:hypothetical protein [Magnetococcales bacterium]